MTPIKVVHSIITDHPTQSPNKGTWIRGCWSGLLANQFHRPTSPSITPAFCFGFAVNCGSSSVENIVSHFRRIPKKFYFSQTGACIEGTFLDITDTCADRDARQAKAFLKGPLLEAGNAIRNCDARQASASTECNLPYTGDAVRDINACQATAETEGQIPDVGNTIRKLDTR